MYLKLIVLRLLTMAMLLLLFLLLLHLPFVLDVISRKTFCNLPVEFVLILLLLLPLLLYCCWCCCCWSCSCYWWCICCCCWYWYCCYWCCCCCCWCCFCCCWLCCCCWCCFCCCCSYCCCCCRASSGVKCTAESHEIVNVNRHWNNKNQMTLDHENVGNNWEKNIEIVFRCWRNWRRHPILFISLTSDLLLLLLLLLFCWGKGCDTTSQIPATIICDCDQYDNW